MSTYKFVKFKDALRGTFFLKRVCAIAVIAFLSGCVPTKQLVNDASVQFLESQDFDDPWLNSNKAGGVAILVSAGYMQVRNERQLSIYLECASLQRHMVTLVSGELLASDRPNLVPENFDITCPDDRRGVRTTNGTYVGAGYLHFFGDDLNDYFKSEVIRLNLSLEIDGENHQISLPLKVKVIWVWPT